MRSNPVNRTAAQTRTHPPVSVPHSEVLVGERRIEQRTEVAVRQLPLREPAHVGVAIVRGAVQLRQRLGQRPAHMYAWRAHGGLDDQVGQLPSIPSLSTIPNGKCFRHT